MGKESEPTSDQKRSNPKFGGYPGFENFFSSRSFGLIVTENPRTNNGSQSGSRQIQWRMNPNFTKTRWPTWIRLGKNLLVKRFTHRMLSFIARLNH